ncbi:unnamed protein product [Vitrella brassicaformis CCMP3155]|uniref:Uncharacterized protein n=1 Tax=Vitrella brassicaformis (strain CCMP3155) TaxID=1169540 RepID=A0A0G4EPP2_VITBC|nr:unnamed protein product [Vitrella brassicaformis CCMP3155]|mmetsp:Transcript_26540/g.65918  ORF Transcript_26540/g.65918 Transcript_26540/m.65918 type:complete len:90 (-) Transcript_26540:630-899(-)|eukprot:CEL99798.1 unnamed protein product [Vitrella brassicaformis CCMP3155]
MVFAAEQFIYGFGLGGLGVWVLLEPLLVTLRRTKYHLRRIIAQDTEYTEYVDRKPTLIAIATPDGWNNLLLATYERMDKSWPDSWSRPA